MTSAFISYTHRDEAFRTELVNHLAPLRRQGLLDVWHDRRLVPGAPLDDTISAELEAADLILMLISSDFVASEYCYGREMTRALERHDAGEARAISIVCRPCHFQGLPFAAFVMLPRDARAVTVWPNQDEAWVDVVNGIRTALSAPHQRPAPRPAPAIQPAARAASPVRLNLPRNFTDLDRHDFLEAAFERMWAVIEASAADLEAQNQGLVVRRVRIDAQAFAVRIFANGQEMGGGSVYIGGHAFGRNQICYSSDPSAPRNTMNEWFSVEVIDGDLKLQSGGMLRMGGGGRDEGISADEAAALLWESMVGQVRQRIR